MQSVSGSRLFTVGDSFVMVQKKLSMNRGPQCAMSGNELTSEAVDGLVVSSLVDSEYNPVPFVCCCCCFAVFLVNSLF